MKQHFHTDLWIVGNNATGKTLLTDLLRGDRARSIRGYKQDYNAWGTFSDWKFFDEGDIIEVRIIESSSIRAINQGIGKNRRPLILIAIRVNTDNTISKRDEHWINDVKATAPDAIILVAFTFGKSEKELKLSAFKRKYPFVEYFFQINDLVERYNEFILFSIVLKQIIVNTVTSRLEYARRLIQKNIERRDPVLDLGNCNLTSLSEVPELFQATHLEVLILSNEWGENNNEFWIRKESRNKIGPNILSHIPDDIGKLNNLRVLICGGNWKSKRRKNAKSIPWGISDLSSIYKIKSLEILNISNNAIEGIVQLSRWPRLIELYLNNNKIKRLSNLTQLNAIRDLLLSNNRISDVAFLEGVRGLRTIDLHSNEIKDITPIKGLISELDIKDSKWELFAISIANNPLVVPTPEIISQGKSSVLAYFKQLEAEQRIRLKPFKNTDVKLVIVGNSNVGKSTLVHWLITKKIDKSLPTTHWLEVGKWSPKYNGENYNVRIFDFGGQEYYHDTHHLFFTNRTAYIVLWDHASNSFNELEVNQLQGNGEVIPVKIQTFPLQYWLDSIKYHTKRRLNSNALDQLERLLDERDRNISESISEGKDWTSHIYSSLEATEELLTRDENILIIQNKVESKSEKKFLNEEKLKSEHKNIFDFNCISVYNQRGLDNFLSALFEMLNELELVNQEFLGTWGHIKKSLEAHKLSKELTISEFRSYCNRTIRQIPGLKTKPVKEIRDVLFSEQDTKVFAQYLNDVGVLLYFPENATLKEKVFVNQTYVLENIHRILLDLSKYNGQFEQAKVSDILGGKISKTEAANILALMLHFKIVFRHPTKELTYIAPLYLPSEPSQSIRLFLQIFGNPCVQYKYKTFIHKNVILEFFHQYGHNAVKDSNSSDLFYYWKNGIIIKDETSGEIVMVQFNQSQKDTGGASLDVYALTGNGEGAFLKQVIADLDIINKGQEGDKCVPGINGDYVPLRTIHDNEKADKWHFVEDGKHYRLVDFKRHLNNPTRMKKVFISYSKKDLKYVNKFREHLSALQLDGKVSSWYCSELTPGTEWDREIQQHFAEADIVCFMISPNFMKTSYIHEYEIAKAFERKVKDPSFKIVPIILEFCSWTTTKNNLGQFTALPYTAKPVSDFVNEDMAWYIIQGCLRSMIEKDLRPEEKDFYTSSKLPSDILAIFERIVAGKVDRSS